MKTISSLFLVLSCLVTGCIHNHTLNSTTSDNYKSLTEQSRHRKAIIVLKNGRLYYAEKLRLEPDSTLWIDAYAKSAQAAKTSEVAHVRFTRRGKGALEGLGLGLLGGAVSGAILGFTDGDEPSDSWWPWTAEEKAIIGGIFFGGMGGLTGILIGAIAGSKDVYRPTPEYVEAPSQ